MGYVRSVRDAPTHSNGTESHLEVDQRRRRRQRAQPGVITMRRIRLEVAAQQQPVVCDLVVWRIATSRPWRRRGDGDGPRESRGGQIPRWPISVRRCPWNVNDCSCAHVTGSSPPCVTSESHWDAAVRASVSSTARAWHAGGRRTRAIAGSVRLTLWRLVPVCTLIGTPSGPPVGGILGSPVRHAVPSIIGRRRCASNDRTPPCGELPQGMQGVAVVEIGAVLGGVKAGVSLYQHLQRRSGFERTIAKEIAGAVPRIQDETGLTVFLQREDIHWLLVLGPLDGEETLADELARWLADGTDWNADDSEVREAAEAAARTAMVAYVTSADEAEHRLLMEFRARQTLEEVRKASRNPNRPRTEGLPPRTGSPLLAASQTDLDSANTLAEILHRDDTRGSIAYDAAAFVDHARTARRTGTLLCERRQFAAAHQVQDTLIRVAEQLAVRSAPDAPRLLVRAALNAPRDVAERLVDQAAELDPQERGPAMFRADWDEDWKRIVSLVPEDTTDSLEALYLARALVHQKNTHAAIRVLDHAAANIPSNASSPYEGGRTSPHPARHSNSRRSGHLSRTTEPRRTEVIERARADAVFAERSIRRWGGDASNPLTVAIQAAVRLHEPQDAIKLAQTPDGQFVDEVSDPEVAAAIAGAAAILNDHRSLEAAIEHVPEGFDRDMVLGFYPRPHRRSGRCRTPALQRRSSVTPDTTSLLRPLFALAYKRGNPAGLPRARVRTEMTDEATLIDAVAAMSATNYDAALASLDGLPAERNDEPQVAAVRAEALLGLGRTDEVVRLLEQVFERTGDVAFLFRAVLIHAQNGNGDAAIALCETHLDGTRPSAEGSIPSIGHGTRRRVPRVGNPGAARPSRTRLRPGRTVARPVGTHLRPVEPG